MAFLGVLRRRKEARAEIDRLIAFLDATEVYVTAAIRDDAKPNLELPQSVLEFLEAPSAISQARINFPK
jgi:hypothetical protein